MNSFADFFFLKAGVKPNHSTNDEKIESWTFISEEVRDSSPALNASSFEAEIKDVANEGSISQGVKATDNAFNPDLDESSPEANVEAIRTEEQDPGLTTKKKKKRNRKKKESKAAERRVSFGFVEEILFTRDISSSSIPSKGAFPIGLGNEESRECWNIDVFTSCQQENLILRAKNACLSVESSAGPITSLSPLETRQFDYRQGINPLFQSLSEEDRILVLSPHKLVSSNEKEKLQEHESSFGTKDKPRIVLNARDRAKSFDSKAGQSLRDRAKSFDVESKEVEPKSSDPRQGSHTVADLNKDIKHIRLGREQSGCTCKPTKIDKLSVGKMKSELLVNGHLIGLNKAEIENMPKAELSSKMRDVLKQCHLCVSNNCECFKSGIECCAEVCGCLRHGYKPGYQQVCDNPEGRQIFDPDVVQAYRKKVVAAANTSGITFLESPVE